MEHERGAAGQRDACRYELRALARWITVDEGMHVNPSKQHAESPEAQSAQNDGDPENGSELAAATNSEILNERGGPAQPSQEVQMHAFTLAHDNLLRSWKRALSISRVRAVHREAKGPVGQGFPARAGRRYRGLPTVGSE